MLPLSRPPSDVSHPPLQRTLSWPPCSLPLCYVLLQGLDVATGKEVVSMSASPPPQRRLCSSVEPGGLVMTRSDGSCSLCLPLFHASSCMDEVRGVGSMSMESMSDRGAEKEELVLSDVDVRATMVEDGKRLLDSASPQTLDAPSSNGFLFVEGIADGVSHMQIKELFVQFGMIWSVYIQHRHKQDR